MAGGILILMHCFLFLAINVEKQNLPYLEVFEKRATSNYKHAISKHRVRVENIYRQISADEVVGR
jgi:hypothetical protein